MEHELAQELAKITLAIQDARREFQGVKDTKELYLQEREQEAVQRVTKALEAACGAIEQANEYAKEVERLRQEAECVVQELKDANVTMQAARRDFSRQTQDARDILDKKTTELEAFTASVAEEKMRINGLLDNVKLERVLLRAEQKKIDDDRAKLKTAIQIWQKQQETITDSP